MSLDGNPYLNIAGYYFTELDELPERRAALRKLCMRLELKGTILISPEGINLFLAGRRSEIDEFLQSLRSDPKMADFEVKESWSDYQPFNRMLVRIKREIIAFGIQEATPLKDSAPRLDAQVLKQWLDEKRELVLLDTRNDYEVEVGAFENAVPIGVGHFRDFPDAVAKLPEDMRDKPVITYCTGGIRCEKAAIQMKQAGFKDVYQLEGGILKYFEEIGGAHYRGDCFVFDQRVALKPDLKETELALCFNCRGVLRREDRQSDQYVPGVSCPRCYKAPESRTAEWLDVRRKSIAKVINPAPGSVPYENRRPIRVTARAAGWTVIEFLRSLKSIHPDGDWLDGIREGRLLMRDLPVKQDQILNSGDELIWVTPGSVEPEVNLNIDPIYEDDAILVLHKPAPLPMHACGRYNRNSLDYILQKAMEPYRPRAAHRLDANTCGLLALAKTRQFAGRLQPQFEAGQVEKIYLVKVKNAPSWDKIVVDTPIAAEPSTSVGGRTTDDEGLPALTEFESAGPASDGSGYFLWAYPKTGRTNQIRAHLWSIGLPVLNDPLFLAEKKLGEMQTLPVGAPPLGLCSYYLKFVHPLTGSPVEFRSRIPEWASTLSADKLK